MTIYGVALLAACTLMGSILGQLIGKIIGINANVGGVGIAMLLLLCITNWGDEKFQLKAPTIGGISFFSAMYIPIVVAMAAKQNVVAAVSGGWMAVLAGLLAVVVSLAVVPLLSKLVRAA